VDSVSAISEKVLPAMTDCQPVAPLHDVLRQRSVDLGRGLAQMEFQLYADAFRTEIRLSISAD
jgi:hypothetical protein